MERLSDYIKEKFNVDIDIFQKALKLSPNAQGYIAGAISEYVLRDYIHSLGYETLRIKEKWEGTKHINHHGDFYVRKKGGKDWYVLESKGVKSNSEKWHKLYNKDSLIKFLKTNVDKTEFSTESEIIEYVDNELPLFNSTYKENFYTYNELLKFKPSKKHTTKSIIISRLKTISTQDLEKEFNKRMTYLTEHIKVIETHLVSGGSKSSTRTQATPRADEFDVLSLDLFLRTGKHEFIFVNPKLLPRSSSDKNHLQQNYIVDILLKGAKDSPNTQPPWTMSFDDVFNTLDTPIVESDMQIDERNASLLIEEIE